MTRPVANVHREVPPDSNPSLNRRPAVKVAVYVAGEAVVAIACDAAPPSDQPAKVHVLPAPSVWVGALTFSTYRSHEVTVCGPVSVVPLTVTCRPGGSVTYVIGSFVG